MGCGVSRVNAVDGVEELVKVVREGHPDQEATARAAYALANFARDGHAAEVVKAGAVEALVGVVRDGRPDQDATANAAAALSNLAGKGHGAEVMVKAGAVEALVGVVRDGRPDQEATANAARALSNLSLSKSGQAEEVVKAGAVEALVGVVRDGRPDQEATAMAAAALGNLAHNGHRAEVVKAGGVEALVGVVRDGSPDQKATARAAGALSNLAFDGHGAEVVVKAGGVEALVGVVRDGRPDQEATAMAAAALGNLATHEPLRAVLRRANLFEPLAEKLDATGLNPFARFQGLAAVAMLYGEDKDNEPTNALLSRHDVARLAVAAARSALAGTKCEELSDESASTFTNLPMVLPQMRSMSVHAQTRDRLMEEGAVPLVVRGLGAADTPTDRVHAIRCLFNFAWAGQTAVLKLRESGAVEAAKPWAETTNDDEMEVRDAARGLIQVLDESTAAVASSSETETGLKKRYGVFLSHKQTDARDFARALYTLFESRNIKCFLDMEFKDDLNDLEAIVSTSKTLLFVLSDNVLESEWCLKELAAAVRHNVKIVMVLKEGARWPDKNGDYVCTFPPYPLIQKLPAEVQPAFDVKAIVHVDSYYKAFVSALLEKLDAQQAQLDSLQGQIASADSSDDEDRAKAHAALKAHLKGVHVGLVDYLKPLHELGVDTVDDLGELAGPSIHTTI